MSRGALAPDAAAAPGLAASALAKGLAALDCGALATAGDIADALGRGGAEGEACYLRGLVKWTAEDRASALVLLERAATLLPERVEVAYNLGVLLRELGRLRDAAAVWHRVVTAAPWHGDAWLALGGAVERVEGGEAGLATYRRAIAALPHDPALQFNHAELLQRLGDAEGAAAAYARLLELHPEFAPAWLNCGMAMKRLGRFETAERCYRRAAETGDGVGTARAWFNLSNLLLLQGRWAEGFAAYEWRLRLPEAPHPHWTQPQWTGDEPPGCRVLLWSDQGFGDTILFLRWAPRVAARGHRVFLLTNRLLVRLCGGAPGIEAASVLEEPLPEFDAQLAVSSLPYAVGAISPEWPGAYLPKRAPISLATPPGATRRVGLVWAGNAAQQNDATRSLRLGDLAPLLDVPGIAWYSLQTGPRSADLAALGWADRVHDLAPDLTDFAATAAAMAALDLVVAVDTASAHLAGALGVPAWVLLPAAEPYCIWGLAGEDTPWYPSLRLIRQRCTGDWSSEVATVAARLAAGSLDVRF